MVRISRARRVGPGHSQPASTNQPDRPDSLCAEVSAPRRVLSFFLRGRDANSIFSRISLIALVAFVPLFTLWPLGTLRSWIAFRTLKTSSECECGRERNDQRQKPHETFLSKAKLEPYYGDSVTRCRSRLWRSPRANQRALPMAMDLMGRHMTARESRLTSGLPRVIQPGPKT